MSELKGEIVWVNVSDWEWNISVTACFPQPPSTLLLHLNGMTNIQAQWREDTEIWAKHVQMSAFRWCF